MENSGYCAVTLQRNKGWNLYAFEKFHFICKRELVTINEQKITTFEHLQERKQILTEKHLYGGPQVYELLSVKCHPR